MRLIPACALAAFAVGCAISPEVPTSPEASAPSATEGGGAPPAAAFDQTLELQGVKFHVSAGGAGAATKLVIAPSGLEIDNSPIARTIDGKVTGADVGDLNVDGSPEIYVYVASPKPGAPATLVAFAANNKKSLSEIYLPAIPDDEAARKGYRGHDDIAVVEGCVVRRIPLYREGDADATPTGGYRQFQYKLVPGEAGWLLKLDKMYDF